MESGVERGRHGRGLCLTFPCCGPHTRTTRRTAQGGADCRGGEDGAGRRGLQRWGSRAAADRNGTTDGAAEARTAQGGAADVRMSREARWTSKCGGYGLGRARQRGNPTDPRQSFPPRVILSRPLSRRAPILPPLPAFAPVGTARTIFDRLRARF